MESFLSVSNESPNPIDYSTSYTPDFIKSYDEHQLESQEIGDFSHKTDNRIRIDNTLPTPWKMICKLIIRTKTGIEFPATGFFIGPRCVITSGHAVYISNDWVGSVEVMPGANEMGAPFEKETATRFRSVYGWTEQKKYSFDYGAIILDDDTLFNRVGGYFGYGVQSKIITLKTAGYSKNHPSNVMFYGAGRMTREPAKMISCMVNMEEGNSGSPYWVGNQIAVGIHRDGSNPGRAVRVTSELMKNWNAWKEL